MAPYSVGPVYRVLPVSSGSASLTEPLVGFHSPPRRTEHADSPHSASCPLRKKVYGTQPIGCAFNPVRSPASTPHHPTASAIPFLYILCLRSCRLPSVFIRRPASRNCQGIYGTSGSLRSLGVTPVHRYSKPFRHLLSFLISWALESGRRATAARRGL